MVNGLEEFVYLGEGNQVENPLVFFDNYSPGREEICIAGE